MANNLAKAAVGALALSAGGDNNVPGAENVPPIPHNNNNHDLPPNQEKTTPVDQNGNVGYALENCPNPPLAKFHKSDICLTKPNRPNKGHASRRSSYLRLKEGGAGASLVPNQQTVVCPLEVSNLSPPTAVQGLDDTWVVENTSTSNVVLSWVVDGVEWSPFEPDVKPMDDPKAILKPGEWTSVPTFHSFVYHVREIEENGGPGKILLQHRMGFIPLGKPNQFACDASAPDIEPVHPKTAARKKEFAGVPPLQTRPCNTMDIGFRNQLGCPINVYYASGLTDVPDEGFNCAERFRFHLGTKHAPQDFMFDWESATHFQGTYIGHTFVARLASDPNVIVDSYTVDTTKIVDCPNLKQQVAVSSHAKAEAVMTAEGTAQPLNEEDVAHDVGVLAASMAGVAGGVSN